MSSYVPVSHTTYSDEFVFQNKILAFFVLSLIAVIIVFIVKGNGDNKKTNIG